VADVSEYNNERCDYGDYEEKAAPRDYMVAYNINTWELITSVSFFTIRQYRQNHLPSIRKNFELSLWTEEK
jgi:hypothetical protein